MISVAIYSNLATTSRFGTSLHGKVAPDFRSRERGGGEKPGVIALRRGSQIVGREIYGRMGNILLDCQYNASSTFGHALFHLHS